MADLIDFFGDLSSVVDDHSSRKASSSERNLGLSLSLDAGFCSDRITKRSEKAAGEEGRKMVSSKRKLEGEGKGNGIGEKEENFRLKDDVVAGKREIREQTGEKKANYGVFSNEVARREKQARQKRSVAGQAKGVNEVKKFQWASSSSGTNGEKEEERKMPEEAMPRVKVERGDGGRTEGFLYKHRSRTEMRIICICHGRFWTPPDFVMHAGVDKVDSPLRHIHVVNPSSPP